MSMFTISDTIVTSPTCDNPTSTAIKYTMHEIISMVRTHTRLAIENPSSNVSSVIQPVFAQWRKCQVFDDHHHSFTSRSYRIWRSLSEKIVLCVCDRTEHILRSYQEMMLPPNFIFTRLRYLTSSFEIDESTQLMKYCTLCSNQHPSYRGCPHMKIKLCAQCAQRLQDIRFVDMLLLLSTMIVSDIRIHIVSLMYRNLRWY